MADKKAPEGLDDFLADMDPQSAIAAQGLTTIGQKVGEIPQVQQALDFQGNLKRFNDLALAAANGDPEAQRLLAEHQAGIAIGSIQNISGPKPKPLFTPGEARAAAEMRALEQPAELVAKPTPISKPIFTTEEAKVVEAGPGALQRLEQKVGSSEDLVNQPGLTQKELNIAMQKANRRKAYAKGGAVKIDTLPAPPAIPVAGLEVSAPAGLDEFIASEEPSLSRADVPVEEGAMPGGLDEFIAEDVKKQKYGTPSQMLKTAAEGAAQGLVGPLAPAIERGLGIDPEDIRARAEVNPMTHYGAEITGLVGPALVTGGGATAAKFTQAGALEALAKIFPKAGETLAAKIGVGAAKAAVDNALIAGSDEVSKLILKDPHQSAQTAISNIGLAGALGGVLGGGLGAASSVQPLWKSTVGDKASKFVEDFRTRMSEHTSTPDPVASVTGELGGYYKKISDVLKSSEQLPIEAKVESGAVAKALKEYMPALKDFERKFTDTVGEERVIHPGKVSSYVSNLGKPNSEIKQSILRNFLEASEKYKKAINEAHIEAGLPPLEAESGLTTTLGTLRESTLGGHAADILVDKIGKGAIGHTLAGGTGAAVGGLLGGHTGAGIGAIIGHAALAPFFNSVLPAIAKSLIKGGTSSSGFKAAVDYGVAVVKGETLLNKASKNVFKLEGAVLPESMMPSEKETAKLEKLLKVAQVNPALMMEKVNNVNHYLPDHGAAMDEATAQAVGYLNSIRPDLDKKAPLDSKPVASSAQKGAYQSALRIAQQPLVVFEKIKQGTVTGQDLTALGSMYPSLFNRMKEKIMEQVAEINSKNEMIPYKTRLGISMFLATPLDSSMSPASIQAAQLANGASPQPQSQEQPSSQGVKSSPALQKMPSMYQSSAQARTQRAQKQ